MDVFGFMHGNRTYFEDFVSRSTYHSNRIEGSTLSLAETYVVQFNASDPMRLEGHTARELYEAINFKYALSLAMAEPEAPLSEALIKKIAVQLNANIGEIDGYRRTGVVILGAEHLPPAAAQVPQLMLQLVHEYLCDEGVDPFLREARFHIRFERIHPFADGNGRTGRILIDRGLMAAGLAPAVIDSDERVRYLGLIADVDYDGLADLLRVSSERESERIEALRP